VATSNAATETIMAYGLWATKVDDRHDIGCATATPAHSCGLEL
jgi:hypothetical protein